MTDDPIMFMFYLVACIILIGLAYYMISDMIHAFRWWRNNAAD